MIEPVIEHIAGTTGEIRLIVDGAKVGNHHQLLIVGIAYRGRAIPLAWTWVLRLTQNFAYRTNLLAYWAKGESEPWLLATNIPSVQATLRGYRRRAWIENLFGDLKGKGFDLEATRLQHFMRLSRLSLLVAVLYLWALMTGAAAIKNGQRTMIDRNDRRVLSLFQIGARWIKRRVTNHLSIHIRLKPV